MVLVLSSKDVESLTNMGDTITAIERAQADAATGTAHNPIPSSVHLSSSNAKFLAMPALADRQQLAAVKFLADIPGNRLTGLPVQRSTILLASQETGEILAILDGRVPTRCRTAAASAVATKYLARPESSCLGLIGAGPLAVAHVEAMISVLPIEHIIVWSRTAASAERFLAQTAYHGLDVRISEDISHVIAAADVVCTLTPSKAPLVQGKWFQPGQHINAVGAPPRPDHREIDTEGITRATVFVDDFGTALQKSGEIVIPIADGSIYPQSVQREIGDVIGGLIPGRQSAREITLFDSVGLGLQDLAIGSLLYDAARAAGVGVEVNLSL
ncbi:ornithine cyclodeaminase family protein [Paenarthrobacter sp. PH39-S1]|uniref:ornithine cyclodeaminase family protein n=1 Tax=Paenarthrobacter sp. PH39-S1 TaxID=3046204 RepID=UPI0024B9270F|nr:ornithine cyclodeaminase family protein [Paenarthrobacter sp. PH39-S1]MDJ0358188.1 ornithine cyclodeaminase family protein [Paenarthrobacter sp. PH39-S1]